MSDRVCQGTRNTLTTSRLHSKVPGLTPPIPGSTACGLSILTVESAVVLETSISAPSATRQLPLPLPLRILRIGRYSIQRGDERVDGLLPALRDQRGGDHGKQDRAGQGEGGSEKLGAVDELQLRVQFRLCSVEFVEVVVDAFEGGFLVVDRSHDGSFRFRRGKCRGPRRRAPALLHQSVGSLGSISTVDPTPPTARSLPALKVAVTPSSEATKTVMAARQVSGTSGTDVSASRIGRTPAYVVIRRWARSAAVCGVARAPSPIVSSDSNSSMNSFT